MKVRLRSSTTDGTPFRELLSYRLHVVANLLSRGAELRYRREFGVSLWEWRSIAILGGSDAPLSLNELAQQAGIHKSQMSRVISGLAGRGLVLRSSNEDDARGVRLELSKDGRRVFRGLIRAASERDAAFKDCLSEKESAVFDRALAKLAGEARRFIQSEKRR